MNPATKKIIRCGWATNDLAIRYHDREWGVPQHDDRVLFEFLVLEGAQAGLSWDTILRKRENYRAAFDDFDLKKRVFTFVGSTICYAFMQAVGMVNDHVVTCFRYRQV